MTLEALWLRAIAFSLLVGILSFMVYFLIVWFVALYQIFVTMFSMMGGPSG